ncbi:hypothetical protein [Bradyrhizobium iriomotense]|uniref:hypothetical protein n=1 Tax=Bradyrhizobium iriomotense TaxID=441950 RepID=UPI001B89FDD3|nr:hypothetical protein [Bradyrhizobium iriomotense]MBR0785110.1 hypothetical protein [Bradyrhizobium iriomotense]
MMMDCAALVTPIALPFGIFRQRTTRHGDCKTADRMHVRDSRKARTIERLRIVHQSRNRARGCVAKQRDDRAWFPRTENEMQNSTCDERPKRSKNLHRNAGWNS